MHPRVTGESRSEVIPPVGKLPPPRASAEPATPRETVVDDPFVAFMSAAGFDSSFRFPARHPFSVRSAHVRPVSPVRLDTATAHGPRCLLIWKSARHHGAAAYRPPPDGVEFPDSNAAIGVASPPWATPSRSSPPNKPELIRNFFFIFFYFGKHAGHPRHLRRRPTGYSWARRCSSVHGAQRWSPSSSPRSPVQIVVNVVRGLMYIPRIECPLMTRSVSVCPPETSRTASFRCFPSHLRGGLVAQDHAQSACSGCTRAQHDAFVLRAVAVDLDARGGRRHRPRNRNADRTTRAGGMRHHSQRIRFFPVIFAPRDMAVRGGSPPIARRISKPTLGRQTLSERAHVAHAKTGPFSSVSRPSLTGVPAGSLSGG